MTIKIVRCDSPHSWYRDRIGQTFEVLQTNEKEKHHIIHKGRVLNSFISFCDCEVVDENAEQPQNASFSSDDYVFKYIDESKNKLNK